MRSDHLSKHKKTHEKKIHRINSEVSSSSDALKSTKDKSLPKHSSLSSPDSQLTSPIHGTC